MMHSDLYLFALALAKVSLLTGFAPALFMFYGAEMLARALGWVPAPNRLGRGEARQKQICWRVGTHPIGSKFGDAKFRNKVSGDGQLAHSKRNLIPSNSLSRATSPSRKEWRQA